MLSGDNSILTRATEARDKTIESQKEEQVKIAAMEAATNLTDTEYKGIKIPAGFAPTKKEGESTVDEGLVITDSSGNEYVWIEVPKTVTASATTDEEIYSALRNYCETDADGGDLIKSEAGDYKTTTRGWTDEHYEGCGLSISEYNTLKSKMLKSIKDNGGFWIGRYEAGVSSPRGNKNDTIDGLIPQSKPDLYPINYVTCSQAQEIASRATNIGNYTSSLMFGIQWDLVLKHLSDKGVATNLLTENSETWGNYYLEYNLNQQTAHGYKGIYGNSVLTWSEIEGGYTYTAGTNEYIALSTGASERNKKQNIYDLAGNMFEWTLEHSTYAIGSNSCPCVVRGGNFYCDGSERSSFLP